MRDAVAVTDPTMLLGGVEHDHRDLAAIVRVDGAGGIQDEQAVVPSQPRAGSDLHLMAGRHLEGEAGRGEDTIIAGDQDERTLGVNLDVVPDRMILFDVLEESADVRTGSPGSLENRQDCARSEGVSFNG